jgi:hypothetical protein
MLRKFNHSYAQHITSAGHLLLLLVGLRIGTAGGWLFVLSAVGGISFVLWVLNFRRARAVADTPTSRVASAPQGYVELSGTARQHPGKTVLGPLTSTPCVWYRYKVEEKRGKNWHVVQRGLSEETFILDDGSGQALVDPDWAEVMTDHYQCWTEGKQRYSEWLLVPNDSLYAIGEFATVGGSSTQLDSKADLSALLADWKKNQPELKRRFDLDGNGQIGPKEWELAVRAARREIARRHQEIRAQPGVNVMRAPGQGQLFLLSNFAPGRLERRYTWWTRAQLAIAISAGAAALWLMVRMAIVH